MNRSFMRAALVEHHASALSAPVAPATVSAGASSSGRILSLIIALEALRDTDLLTKR
jgi:hypothetical protein